MVSLNPRAGTQQGLKNRPNTCVCFPESLLSMLLNISTLLFLTASQFSPLPTLPTVPAEAEISESQFQIFREETMTNPASCLRGPTMDKSAVTSRSRPLHRDFPHGPVVKNLPSDTGDIGSIPDWGTRDLTYHRTTKPVPQLLSPRAPEPMLCDKRSPHSPTKTQKSQNKKRPLHTSWVLWESAK